MLAAKREKIKGIDQKPNTIGGNGKTGENYTVVRSFIQMMSLLEHFA